MFNCFRRPVIGALFFVLFFHSAKSQELDFGISGGGAYYLGDLNPGTPFLKTQPSFGALLRYNIDTRWSVKLGGTYGTVKVDTNAFNDSSFIKTLGLSFSSYITDISAVVEFNFFPYFTGSERNRITPYIYAGISVFFFNPKNGGISLKDLGTEGQREDSGYMGRKPYSLVGISIPFGLGIKVSLAKRLGLQVYWEMHKTFTDYLDDVSTTYYVTNGSFVDEYGIRHEVASGTINQSDPLATHEASMQRGDPNTKDWFSFFGVSMTYKFNMPWSTKGYYQIHSAGKEWTR